MPPDGPVHVVVERARGDDAGLAAAALLEAIEVVAFVRVAHERAVGGPFLEDPPRGRVDVVRVHVVVGAEGGLGAVDREEGGRVGGHIGGGLAAVEDVVGQRGERRRAVGNGPQAGEGQCAHWYISSGRGHVRA